MNTQRPSFIQSVMFPVCLAVGLGPLTCARAAAVLEVSPAAITNDYVGNVTLTVTGLTPGKSVSIERYADLNGNGTVDASEFAVRSFIVTDGQLPVIGGVRDLNVPGDDDATTNSQLRVELPLPGLDAVLDLAAGSFFFRVTDPQGGFAPVTQPFVVKAKPLPQGVTGRLTAAGTGVALSNAFVVVLHPDGPGGYSGFADSDGKYTIYTPPGDYSVAPLRAGFVADFEAGFVTVVSGQFVTNNLAVASGTLTLSGRVTDSATGAGLPALLLFAESPSNRFAVAFADSTGAYTFALTPGPWKINVSENQAAMLGRVALRHDVETNVTSNVSNLDFQLPKATAVIYGTVRDDQNVPVPGIGISADDSNDSFKSSGRSLGTAGDYTLGVLAGEWNVSPFNDELGPLGYSSQGTNVTIAASQAVRADFLLRRVTAHLRGRVVDGSGNPVSDIGVTAYTFTGGNSYVDTAFDGSFDLGVFAGEWNLQVDSFDAQERGSIGPQLVFTITDGTTVSDIIMVLRNVTVQISGFVRDAGGAGLADIGVSAQTTIGGTNYNSWRQTDSSGNYSLGVFNETWQVSLECSKLESLGFRCPQGQTVTITGANGVANFTVQMGGPTINQITRLPGGQFQLFINGPAGRQYRVEGTTNFLSWSALLTTNPPSGFFDFVDQQAPTLNHRFYRVQLP